MTITRRQLGWMGACGLALLVVSASAGLLAGQAPEGAGSPSEALPQTVQHVDGQGLARTSACFAPLRGAAVLTEQNLTQMQRIRAVKTASAFARDNLHAWAFEEYDAVARTPAERARMLRALGLTRAGFIGRHVERLKELDAYVAAYREHDIELIAVWTPINTDTPLEEPHIRMFLDGVARHRLRLQWWVTLERFDEVPNEQRVERAVAILRPVVEAAAVHGLRLALYGHGRDAWFTQPENEIAIVDRLRSMVDAPVGITYNFHHAHSQLDRFALIFPKLKPYLIAVNLNGMKAAGPQIVPVGQGDREREMIALIHRSGYRGPVGLIAHQRKEDAAEVLSRNMAGLRRILEAIGDAAGASTF